MAPGNFIGRASQALLQVLRTKDTELLLERLNSITVAIVYDETFLKLPNVLVMLNTAINVMSRLYPKIAIVYKGEDSQGEKVKAGLIERAKEINPDIEIANQDDSLKAALCLGVKSVDAELCIFLNADAWNFEVIKNRPSTTLSGYNYNPIAAVAAVGFGSAEVFNYIFEEVLPRQKKQEYYLFSLLDYSATATPLEELPAIHLNDVSLVGLGAIGNAAVWSLSHLKALTGDLYLIDHETVELSNLQRYLLTKQVSINRYKTDIAKVYLERSGLNVYPIHMKLGDYARKERPNCKFDIIAVSVDNAQDRIAAQALLPRIILNAWTGDSGYLGASRHWFDSNLQACLACLYLTQGKRKSDVDILSEATGLESRMVGELLVRKTPLSSEHIAAIVKVKNFPLEILKHWEGRLITDFYAQAICGGLLLKYSDELAKAHVAIVPLAHQSVLAGALLAAEIVKSALKITSKDDNAEIKMDVFNPPSQYVCQRRMKTLNPRCICTDKDYIEIYQNKYSDAILGA